MGRAYPQHPIPSCHALIYHNGSILLVQRGKEPLKGFWGLPGGGVELGETVEEALVREVHEETGLRIQVERFLYYQDAINRDGDGRVHYHYVVFYYHAKPVGGELRAGDDAAAAVWSRIADLDSLELTDSVRQALERARLT